MRITLLCSDKDHPIRSRLLAWMQSRRTDDICLVDNATAALGGDFLFLISCHEFIGKQTRDSYHHALVIHASDLPRDRGWSPHVWGVIRGDRVLTVTLLEAEDVVDSGRIWNKLRIPLVGNEVAAELNELLFSAEIELLEWALANYETVKPTMQDECAKTYLRRRVPQDSRLDPQCSIADQFDLLRVCDSKRYPAFFEFRGRLFKLEMTPIVSLNELDAIRHNEDTQN